MQSDKTHERTMLLGPEYAGVVERAKANDTLVEERTEEEIRVAVLKHQQYLEERRRWQQARRRERNYQKATARAKTNGGRKR